MGTHFVLVAITSLTTLAPPPTPGPAAPPMTDAATPAALSAWKARIEAKAERTAAIASQSPRCASDVLCMTRLAEQNDARFVFWTESSPVRVRWVIYDVRTGERRIKRILPNIAFDPAELESFLDEALPANVSEPRFCIIGVYDEGEPSLKDLYRTDIPWTLYGSVLMFGGGGAFAIGGGVLFASAVVYATGLLPDAAGAPAQSATLLALSGMMTTLLAAGLLMFGAMGATFWLLEEGPLKNRDE